MKPKTFKRDDIVVLRLGMWNYYGELEGQEHVVNVQHLSLYCEANVAVTHSVIKLIRH